MDPSQEAIVNEGDERSDLPLEVVVRRGHETRVRGRRAVRPMDGHHARNLLGVRRCVRRSPSTVTVQVHETGEEQGYCHVGVGGRTFPQHTDLSNNPVRDAQPRVAPLTLAVGESVGSDHQGHAPTLGHGWTRYRPRDTSAI